MERALIATDATGKSVILATDSNAIQSDINEFENSYAWDVGLIKSESHLSPGLYLWEGSVKVTGADSPDPLELFFEYTGKLRPVRPEEVARLYQMKATCSPPVEDDRDSPE